MTLQDICESMRVGYAAKLVKILVPESVFAFEASHGSRFLVERKDDKVVVYSYHTMLRG